MGLLEIAQEKKSKSTEILEKPKTEQEITFDDPHGLLAKAQLLKEKREYQQKSEIKGKNVDIIKEETGIGWNNIGSRRIVFDKDIIEYRYEIIEPELTEFESEKKKELSHLFKMLADIDAFNMEIEEKEVFLKQTLDQIIDENNISFIPEKKGKGFLSKLKVNKEENNEDSEDLDLETDQEMTPEQIEESKNKIFYYLFRDFLGYGRIDVIMKDDDIEDISCDGHETPIFIYHRKYEAIETNVYFDGELELNSFIVRICQLSGKQISIYSPIVDGKLPDGSRLQGTLARTVTRGSTFTIRKFKENPLTPLDLIKHKSLSHEMAAYFWMAIESGASILFCGGTASGKTTALNALSLFIPASHKIISIEDTREVSLPHKNWIAGTTRTGFSSSEANKTGKDIDMFDLIRAALRQRPRVIIVGEVRGKEAYSLFQAMATGHTSYATVHASTIHTLIQRLENPPISLPRALLTSLDVIVFQNAVDIDKKMVRRMTSVTEIIKLDSDTNQLIFMAPFQWVSKTDDRFESSKTSKIMNRIKQQNDWNDEQLEEEITNRTSVLEWMEKNNVSTYKDFGRVIAEYQKYPTEVLKRVHKELKA
jgi:flagellar protein FlaI